MRISRPIILWLLTVLPLLAVLLFIILNLGSEADTARFFHEHRNAHPGLKDFMAIVTNYSNPLFYAVYAWLLYKGWKSGDKKLVRFVLIYIVVQLAVSLLLVRLLKIAIGRPRPGVDGHFQFMSTSPSHHSLPSGHTTEITGAVLPLSLRLSQIAASLGFGLFLALVGFSRIYLGWHHPTDVFFGLLLGSVAGFAIHLFSQKD